MNAAFLLALTATLFSVSALWIYWGLLYPALVLRARFKIMEVKLQARILVADREILPNSKSYLEFEHFVQLSDRLMEAHEILGIHSARHPQNHEIEEIRLRIESILKEQKLTLLFFELMDTTFSIYVASSFNRLVPATIFLASSYFSDFARRFTERGKKEAYAVAENIHDSPGNGCFA